MGAAKAKETMPKITREKNFILSGLEKALNWNTVDVEVEGGDGFYSSTI